MFFGVINRKILAHKPNESEIDTFHTLMQRSSGKIVYPQAICFSVVYHL
ncbi:hypothetical protein Pgin01_00121 [Porphyromonas gingivalis]